MTARQATLWTFIATTVGVLGGAVLASIFARYGGYESPATFNDGLVPGIWVGAVVVGLGAASAFFIPRRMRLSEATHHEPERPVSQPETA